MAVLIAIMVVAFLVWQQAKKAQRVDADVAPPPIVADRPFPATPRAIEARSSDLRGAALSPTSPAPADIAPFAIPTPYAFASRRSDHRPDRTARLQRLARGKGLCSPRRPSA